MASWYLKQRWIPFAACILVLQTFGCQDLDRAGDQSAKSEHSNQAAKKHATPEGALQGSCSKKDRVEYIHDSNPKFVGHVQTCSKETWANRGENIACLTKSMPALSNGCAGCFADMASCALANCKLPCMFSSTSEGCTKCANTNCQASLIKCTGVARADLP